MDISDRILKTVNIFSWSENETYLLTCTVSAMTKCKY